MLYDSIRPLPYSEEIFSSIPMDTLAFSKVMNEPISEEAMEAIKHVFHQYKVEKDLGLTLVHRHFDLAPGERLVEYDNVASPWVLSEVNPLLQKRIHAKRWVFVDGSLFPYEFNFSTRPVESEYQFDPDFLAAFHSVLRDSDLEDTLGLAQTSRSTWRPDQPSLLEFTTGRSNVLIPITADLEDNIFTEAQWIFPCIWDPLQDGNGAPQTRYCAVKCFGHPGGIVPVRH